MVVASVDLLVEALRETNLLRAEQYRLLVAEIIARFEDPQDLATHLVGQGWITRYQADELLDGRGQELLLGHYVILDLIGEGGMGKVFKAKQLRLNRVVALKVIHPDLLNNELALKRFRREATAAAQLCHPNIVRLYDADRAGDRHFLVMEYVSGVDLAERVREARQLSVANACSYVRQAAMGLQHAHDLGLVHRDIKPNNLLLTTANVAAKTSGGGVKILDMGLARIAPGLDNESDLTALTQEGAVIGTPDYMSPEQAKNGSDVDARSDLYSLGCTLFFLLSGRPPFRVGTTLEKLLQHQMDAPPHIQMYRPDVPNEVATIIQILLAKRPDDRFQSGLALADALEPWSIVEMTDRRPAPVDAKCVANAGHSAFNKSVRTAVAPEPSPVVVPNNAERLEFEAAGRTKCERPKTKGKCAVAPPVRTRHKRFAWLAAIFVGVGLAVGCIIAARNSVQMPVVAPSAPEQTKEEPRPQPLQEKELPLPPRKAVLEPLDAFLPVDTEFIAIINVQQLAKSKSFAEQIKPKFEAELKALHSAASFDPLTSVDLVIVAVPALSENQEIMIVQGTDFLSSELLNWVGTLPGVEVDPTTVPGHGMKDVYRMIRDKGKGEGDLFGAILSINPSRVVLSPSRQRVIEALARVGRTMETKFDDPTIQPMLSRYSPKPVGQTSPPAVWMALGARAKRFGFDNAIDSGLQSIIGTLRLEHGIAMEVTLSAGSRAEAIAAWSSIAQFAREATVKNPGDRCVQRIASLILQATPAQFPGATSGPTFVGCWSAQIESEKLSEWVAPFFKKPWLR